MPSSARPQRRPLTKQPRRLASPPSPPPTATPFVSSACTTTMERLRASALHAFRAASRSPCPHAAPPLRRAHARARRDLDELRELLGAWRDAKAGALRESVAWVIRICLVLVVLGMAVKAGFLGRLG